MSDDRGERERFEDWFWSVRPPRDTAIALRWLGLSRSHGFAGSPALARFLGLPAITHPPLAQSRHEVPQSTGPDDH
jgi:hypothetical protein